MNGYQEAKEVRKQTSGAQCLAAAATKRGWEADVPMAYKTPSLEGRIRAREQAQKEYMSNRYPINVRVDCLDRSQSLTHMENVFTRQKVIWHSQQALTISQFTSFEKQEVADTAAE